MIDAVHKLFGRYQNYFEQGLRGDLDYDDLSNCYSSEFIAAGPHGVATGKSDPKFIDVMRAGYARCREIGTRGMAIRTIGVDEIDQMHDIAHVGWRST